MKYKKNEKKILKKFREFETLGIRDWDLKRLKFGAFTI